MPPLKVISFPSIWIVLISIPNLHELLWCKIKISTEYPFTGVICCLLLDCNSLFILTLKASPKIAADILIFLYFWEIRLDIACESSALQLSSALSSACYFKSHCCRQCGPRGAVWSGSTLFAYMQNVSLKSLQEDAADDVSRRHFQMQIFLAL